MGDKVIEARAVLHDETEAEIAELRQSPYVRLAKKEEALRYKRRQYLYTLRSMEKRGRRLAEAGVTVEALEEEYGEYWGQEE